MEDTSHFWRFVPEDFPITSTNWSTAPDSISYSPLNSDTTDNFVGMIYGDVSGNWNPSAGALIRFSSNIVDIKLEDIYGEAGDKVILPIKVENGSDMVAMSFSLEYDANVLKALSATITELTHNWQIAHNVEEGQIKVALAGSKPIAESGAIVKLEFEVLETGTPDAKSLLNIPQISINEGNIRVNIHLAEFTPGSPVPEQYALSQNYPNPFNAQTTIRYQLPKAGKVVLKIYNTLGQTVRTLVNADKKAGYHAVLWDGINDEGSMVSSGIYIYQLQTKDFTKTKKMLLMM